MFNLEQSISQWRGQMLSAGVKNPDIVDELESHLREDLVHRVQSGESEEQAFKRTVQAVGQTSLLKHEFAKLSGKKWAWLRKLKGIMAGAFVCSLFEHIYPWRAVDIGTGPAGSPPP